MELTNLNGLFFFFIALIPFSAHFLGKYLGFEFPIILYALHLMLIGLSLAWMRNYILYSGQIERIELTKKDLRHGTIRMILPIILALLAIPTSFFSIWIAYGLLVFSVLSVWIRGTVDIVDQIIPG